MPCNCGVFAFSRSNNFLRFSSQTESSFTDIFFEMRVSGSRLVFVAFFSHILPRRRWSIIKKKSRVPKMISHQEKRFLFIITSSENLYEFVGDAEIFSYNRIQRKPRKEPERKWTFSFSFFRLFAKVWRPNENERSVHVEFAYNMIIWKKRALNICARTNFESLNGDFSNRFRDVIFFQIASMILFGCAIWTGFA